MNFTEKNILSKINAHLAKSEINRHYQEDKILLFNDIREVIKRGTLKLNPLTYVLERGLVYVSEREENNIIKLDDDELNYLINNSDLSFDNGFGRTALTAAVSYSDFNNLTIEQYKKLIDNCPQIKENADEHSCDLLLSLNNDKLKFTEEMWRELIRKTDKKIFNSKKTFLLPYLLLRAESMGMEIIEAEVLADKLDVDLLRTTTLGTETLYSAARHNFELGVMVAERMGAKVVGKCVMSMKESNHSLETIYPGLFEKLDKIAEIVYDKEAISQGVNSKKPGKNANKI